MRRGVDVNLFFSFDVNLYVVYLFKLLMVPSNFCVMIGMYPGSYRWVPPFVGGQIPHVV